MAADYFLLYFAPREPLAPALLSFSTTLRTLLDRPSTCLLLVLLRLAGRRDYRLFVQSYSPDFSPDSDAERAVLERVLKRKRIKQDVLLTSSDGGGGGSGGGGGYTEPLFAATPPPVGGEASAGGGVSCRPLSTDVWGVAEAGGGGRTPGR